MKITFETGYSLTLNEVKEKIKDSKVFKFEIEDCCLILGVPNHDVVFVYYFDDNRVDIYDIEEGVAKIESLASTITSEEDESISFARETELNERDKEYYYKNE